MSSENEANQSISNEESPYGDLNQIQTEIVTEMIRCQKFQEEIVQKINQSKKALYKEEQYLLHQSKKIKEIETSIIASSKVLEQETYEFWKFTQSVSNVRDLCQDVNVYSERTIDILNRCAQNMFEFKKQVQNLMDTSEERKSRIDRKMETPRHKLQELEIGNERDTEWYKSEKVNLLKKIDEEKQKKQIVSEASLESRSRLGKAQECEEEIKTQIDSLNLENTESENKFLAKQEHKQFLLASIENNGEYFNAKINEMKSALEDAEIMSKQITEENEPVEKALEEEKTEDILFEITEGTKQLDYYNQKCLETETEGKQVEEQFTQEYNKAASKIQDLTDSLLTSEQKLSEDKKIKSQLETESTAMIEEIQLTRNNIEQIKNEISKLESLNKIKAKDLSEAKASADTRISFLVQKGNEFYHLTKKLNEKEMEKSQELMKITGEIQELEKQIQEVKDINNAKLSELSEEMESYKIKASENLLRQQEGEKLLAQYLNIQGKLVKERESIIDNTKQMTNDLQGVTLECNILLKKVEETQKRSNFTRSHTYRKRDLDEMSDSSMEGIISVQEHLQRQKSKAHN